MSTDAELDAAIATAADEIGLASYYRDCVRPLVRSGPAGYPRCCGGGCEPCADTLAAVADRAIALLGGSHAK